MPRDESGRSLHDRDAGIASETREMVEADRRTSRDKAAPFAIVVAILFVVAVVAIVALR